MHHRRITDDEIKMYIFVIYIAERALRGCGASTYVTANHVSECVTHSTILFSKIILYDNKCLTIGNIYRPPSANTEGFF